MKNVLKTFDANGTLNNLEVMVHLIGQPALDAIENVRLFCESNGIDDFSITSFGTFICVHPNEVKDVRMESVLVIEMATGQVFIDEYAFFGKKISAKEVYAEHLDSQAKRKAELEEAALDRLTDKVWN